MFVTRPMRCCLGTLGLSLILLPIVVVSFYLITSSQTNLQSQKRLRRELQNSSRSCSSLESSVRSSRRFKNNCSRSNTQYYCNIDGLCKSRVERCTSSPSCVYLNGTEMAGCNCDALGRCCIILGSHSLQSSNNKQELGQVRLEHNFIEYKGFVWEYGCYGTRVLDMNDPLFASQRQSTISRNTHGKSSCSYNEALLFLQHTGNKYTAANYDFLFNKCQDFSAAFSRWLLDDCTRKPASPVDLADYFIQLIESCSPNATSYSIPQWNDLAANRSCH